MSPLRFVLLSLCLLALVALSAGQATPTRAQVAACRRSCDASVPPCKAACASDVLRQARCVQNCEETVLLCKHDCKLVEAELTERQQRRWNKANAAGSLAPVASPSGLAEAAAAKEAARPSGLQEAEATKAEAAKAAEAAAINIINSALPAQTDAAADFAVAAPAGVAEHAAMKEEQAGQVVAAAAAAAVQPLVEQLVQTPAGVMEHAALKAEQAAAAAAAAPAGVAEHAAQKEEEADTEAVAAAAGESAATVAAAILADPASAASPAEKEQQAGAVIAAAAAAAVEPLVQQLQQEQGPAGVQEHAAIKEEEAAAVAAGEAAAAAATQILQNPTSAADATKKEQKAGEVVAAAAAAAVEPLTQQLQQEQGPAGVQEHAALKAEQAAAAAAGPAVPEIDGAQAAGAVARAEESIASESVAASIAPIAAAPENQAAVTSTPGLHSLAPAAASQGQDSLPIVAATIAVVPGTVTESAAFNLNNGGGVWKRGTPSKPRSSPIFTTSNSPRTMSVADLPLHAKISMLLAEGSYRVKAMHMDAQMATGAASVTQWRRVLTTYGREFSAATAISTRMKNLIIVSSSWDSVLFAYRESNGKYTLYVGGHGSVMNSADWLGQNVGLSKISEFVGSTVNWVASFFGKQTPVDLPRQRSTRWVEAVERAFQTAPYKNKISSIVVFGHSMSAYQGHLAATTLAARFPSTPLEAWLLNPGGMPAVPNTSNKNIHHLVVPGEAMAVLGLGGGDPRMISLSLRNIEPAAAATLTRPIYLHGIGLVTDDIRQWGGVAARVQVCTRPGSSRFLECDLRALDGSSAFSYNKANGVHFIRSAGDLPKHQCHTVTGLSMASVRTIAAADAKLREWSAGASHNEMSHNSCHWVNNALFQSGVTGVESFLDGTLPAFRKFGN